PRFSIRSVSNSETPVRGKATYRPAARLAPRTSAKTAALFLRAKTNKATPENIIAKTALRETVAARAQRHEIKSPTIRGDHRKARSTRKASRMVITSTRNTPKSLGEPKIEP